MFIGLDLGTTNVKAVLRARSGKILSRASAPVRLLHVGPSRASGSSDAAHDEGGIEQDLEEIWSAALAALRGVGHRGRVLAIGVSAQGGALQMLDGGGHPSGKVISWLDGRGQRYADEITRRLGRGWWNRHTGTGCCNFCASQLLRLKAGVSARSWRSMRVSYVGDAIVARLCGRAAHDATSLSIAGLYNPSLRAADPDLLRKLDLGEERLPALVSVRTPAGRLRKEAADAASLPAGIRVSAAVHDQYAASLGAGVIHAGDVMFGAGTAWVLLAAHSRLPKPVSEGAYVCTHLVDGLYSQMLSMANGGSSFSWAIGLLGWTRKGREETDAALSSVRPGSDGLRFWPLLAPGGGVGLAPGTRGRLAGLHLSHGPAHVLRAVVEGLAFELARHLEMLKRGGAAPKRLVMCGGGKASRVTPQIVADVTGLPVACAEEAEMSALGAAMIARGLVEPKARLAALSEEMTPALRMFRPGGDSPSYRRWAREYAASLPRSAPRARSGRFRA